MILAQHFSAGTQRPKDSVFLPSLLSPVGTTETFRLRVDVARGPTLSLTFFRRDAPGFTSGASLACIMGP